MKPSFQAIVDKQRVADHRLNRDKTSRSEPELANYRRVLQPVPLADTVLPKLPLVREPGGLGRSVLLGEIAQLPGQVLLFDLDHQTISIGSAERLELVPPGQ